MSETLYKPGFRLGCYPQKKESDLSEFEQAAAVFFEKIYQPFTLHRLNQNQIVKLISSYEKPLIDYSETDLTKHISELKEKLVRFGLTSELIAQAFATIREAAARTLRKRHYDVQLYGGWIMINGMLAEMATGEGKTLTTTLPACTAAMAGIPVHVITANDYLAARDVDIMQPLYQRLGLSAASVIDGMDKHQRRKNYQSHIVHTTNKQIAFDYLRDRMEIGKDTGFLKLQFQQNQQSMENDKGGQLLLKGLCFALIDEADSVLVDEAKTPLIITQTKPNEYGPETYSDALYLAAALAINHDYLVDSKARKTELTQQGEDKLANSVSKLPKHWQNKRKREMLVNQALTASHFYKKDKHYVVQGDKIQIVDEFTGRIMPDRSWEQGLHQLIEAKEGCRITEQRETIARISYQNFFIRYLRLAGTSGTLKEVSSELHSVYGLRTIKVQPHTSSKRIMMPERVYKTLENKKTALLARVSQLYAQHRPILIGTATVEESQAVSSWLAQAGFPHRLLNATQDRYEAEIIAQAAQQNAITVATNMAGRGTDIELGLGVSSLGGLHVIALNSNESRRIDRQLYGRSARQKDPGSAEAILSLQDPAFQHFYSTAMLKVFGRLCNGQNSIPTCLANLILRFAQQMKERRQRSIREQVMKFDRQMARILAFSGKPE